MRTIKLPKQYLPENVKKVWETYLQKMSKKNVYRNVKETYL